MPANSRVILRLLSQPAEFVAEPSGERGGGRILALLAYLVLNDRPVTRDEICEILWDPEDGKDSQRLLRELLSRVRRVVPAGAIVTSGRTLAAVPSAFSCDVLHFRRAVAEGRLIDAAALYTTDFMAGASVAGASEFNDWIDSYGREIKREYLRVLRALVDEHNRIDAHEKALIYAESYWRSNEDDADAATILLQIAARCDDPRRAREIARSVGSYFGTEIPQELRQLADKTLNVSMSLKPRGQTTIREMYVPAPKPRVRKWPYVGAAIALLGLAITGLVILPARATDKALYGGGGTLLMKMSDGSVRAIQFTGEHAADTASAVVARADSLLAWYGRYMPVTRLVARSCARSNSNERQICVDSINGKSITRMNGAGADGGPLSWAPDGRWLLVRGSVESSRYPFNYEAFAANIATHALVRLTRDASQSGAIWSPDGSRIALIGDNAGSDSLIIRTVNGELATSFAFDGDIDAQWLPDGTALLVIRTRKGQNVSAFLVSERGILQRAVMPLRSASSVSWAPDSKTFAILGTLDDSRDFVAFICSTLSCQSPDLQIPEVTLLQWLPHQLPSYVNHLNLVAESTKIHSGGRVRLRIDATDQRGQAIKAPYVTLTVTNEAHGWIDSAQIFHAARPGRTILVASAGGWRTDTLEVTIEGRPARLMLGENWDLGISSDKWKLYGDPLPVTVRRGNTVAFRNNGDDFYPSGAVTKTRFDLTEGITLEWRQRTPWTGDLWQEVWIDFINIAPDSFRTGPGDPYPAKYHAAIQIRAPQSVYQPPSPMLQADCGKPPVDWSSYPQMPREARDTTWHDFIFQYHPTGGCELFIDGKRVSSTARAPVVRPGQYLLAVGGRTWKTDVLIDDIRLWRGIRWFETADGRAVKLGQE